MHDESNPRSHPYTQPSQEVGPTPGDWLVHPHGDGDPCASYSVYAGNIADAAIPTRAGADFYRICRTTDGFRHARSDAHLIAAAPQLWKISVDLLGKYRVLVDQSQTKGIQSYLDSLHEEVWRP